MRSFFCPWHLGHNFLGIIGLPSLKHVHDITNLPKTLVTLAAIARSKAEPVCVRGDIGSWAILNVAAKVRLRPHRHKHRRGAGQFLRILHSYLLE